MKILYVANEVKMSNGWAVINYHTISQAVQNGDEVDVLLDSESENILIEGANYIRILPPPNKIGKNFLQLWELIKKIKRLEEEKEYDVIHVLVEPYLFLYARKVRARLIMSLVGTYSISIFKIGYLKSKIYRYALENVSKFVSISKYTAELFSKEVVKNRDIEVVPLGVDFQRFNKLYKDKKNEKEKSFCLVGQVKARKGVLYAIKAIEEVIVKYSDVKLFIVGDFNSSYGDQCRKYVGINNLENNVIFKGRVSDEELESIYQRSLANLLPSVNTDSGSFEGFGLVHLEANASGLPSVGSWGCGNESAIVDGVSGFLCNQKDEFDIANKMIQIIDAFEDDSYFELVQSSILHAKENDWSLYYPKVKKAYIRGSL